jgi:vacuolar-type H+-ATPase subunit E/Vma4
MKAPARPRKPRSRYDRWQAALDHLRDLSGEGRGALDSLHGLSSKLRETAEVLRAIRDEYEDWLDRLPEGNLGEGATRDKLEEITDIDIDGLDDTVAEFGALADAIEADAIRDALDAIDDVLDEIEAVEPPRGGGRD